MGCAIPQSIWGSQSVIPHNLIPHGLRQALILIREGAFRSAPLYFSLLFFRICLGDDKHFSLAEVTGSFEFKILLIDGEIFFSTFLHNPELLYLTQW